MWRKTENRVQTGAGDRGRGGEEKDVPSFCYCIAATKLMQTRNVWKVRRAVYGSVQCYEAMFILKLLRVLTQPWNKEFSNCTSDYATQDQQYHYLTPLSRQRC